MGLRTKWRRWRQKHFPRGLDADPTQERKFVVGKSQVSVGRYTYGVELLEISQWNEGASLTIGGFCSIASGSRVMLGGNHRTDWMTTFPFGFVHQETLKIPPSDGHPSTRGNVVIGHDVWVGSGATILSGVTIGDGAVVGANTLVASDVAPYTVVGGNPGKFIRDRFSSDIATRLHALEWWHWDQPALEKAAPLLMAPPDAENLAALETIAADQQPY